MSKKIRYVITYPEISSNIQEVEVESCSGLSASIAGYGEHFATWDQAHEYLCSKAMQSVMKTRDELNRNINHLDRCLSLQKP